VNVSSRQLSGSELGDAVRDAVQGIAPDALTLEITESAATEITDAAVQTLTDLRDLGVTIAIDDLGTGHSSLARLRQLPVHELKIDRQFISGMTASTSDRSIVLAIIAMAQALGLITVAEGVENEEQAAILRRAGCLLAQGYFYGQPHTAAELEAILDRGGPLPHRSAQPEHLVDERADHPGHCRGGVLRVGGGQQRVADRQPYE
jgi:EAL domain-containing protein (putative c-di-GMP-specific phosphodiesterase class I)